MADLFRKTLDSLCCPGGVHCKSCRNKKFRGKDRAKLNRIARAKLKEKQLKEIEI